MKTLPPHPALAVAALLALSASGCSSADTEPSVGGSSAVSYSPIPSPTTETSTPVESEDVPVTAEPSAEPTPVEGVSLE